MAPIMYIFQFDGKEAIMSLGDIILMLTEEEKKKHKQLIELCREDEKIVERADRCLDLPEEEIEELYRAGVRLSQRAAELEDLFQDEDKIKKIEDLLKEISQKPTEDIQGRQIVLMDWLSQYMANRKTLLEKIMGLFDWKKAGRA